MSASDDTKTALSIADEIEALTAVIQPEFSIPVSHKSAAQCVAALRAVETVRAFPKMPYRCPWMKCGRKICVRCKAYRDGVEAVQALLEGEK